MSLVKESKNQEEQAYLPSGAVHHDRQVRWIHQLSRVRYKGYESRNFVGIANALEVSTDTLLNRQLTGATEMSNAEAQKIFANCTPYETYVLLDVLKTTKNALRSHHHLLKDEW